VALFFPWTALAPIVHYLTGIRSTATTVAKTIEISADSPNNCEDAIQEGVKKAGSTLEHIQRAWVKDQIVLLNEGKIEGYRVHMQVTFRLN
jgi:dodecin